MPDKLNEIKKAYELCFSEKGTSYTCAVCPYHQFGKLCKVNRNRDALDLINRLQAENTVLLGKIEGLEANRVELLENIEHLESVITQIKAEAYKEFAELAVERVDKAKQKYQRLCKEQGEEMEEHMHIHFDGITRIINNLLKKLVGDGDG